MKSSTPLTVKVLIALMSLLEAHHTLAYKPAYFFSRSFEDFSVKKKKYYLALYNALKYKYLRKKIIKGVAYFEITKKGRYKALQYVIKDKKRKKWDGKWRLIIFDIPEEKSYLRQNLRENLELLGFKYLQKSVWITPYNVRKELGIVVDYLNLHPYLQFMLIDILEDDDWLRKRFRIY